MNEEASCTIITLHPQRTCSAIKDWVTLRKEKMTFKAVNGTATYYISSMFKLMIQDSRFKTLFLHITNNTTLLNKRAINGEQYGAEAYLVGGQLKKRKRK